MIGQKPMISYNVSEAIIICKKDNYTTVTSFCNFSIYGRHFLVTQCPTDRNTFHVTEASTGYKLHNVRYEDVSYAVQDSLSYIKLKRNYFATTIGNILVKSQRNLTKANVYGVSLAVNSLLI